MATVGVEATVTTAEATEDIVEIGAQEVQLQEESEEDMTAEAGVHLTRPCPDWNLAWTTQLMGQVRDE